MTCIKPELIQKYIDNETSAKESACVDEHLKQCGICRRRVEARRQLSRLVVNSVNNLVKIQWSLPPFVPERKIPGSSFFVKRRIIYSLSAACVLFLIVFTIVKSHTSDNWHINIVNTIGPGVDANKPITEQEMIINIIDQDGKVTELKLD